MRKPIWTQQKLHTIDNTTYAPANTERTNTERKERKRENQEGVPTQIHDQKRWMQTHDWNNSTGHVCFDLIIEKKKKSTHID